ncbi:MAG: amino acid ABC transporter permease [Cyanobacteria bacterium HKST-UBA06]|nr:amino acid ABC transporter permease [Cyanobacteria bacterium HKST-UBA06]
MADQTGTLLYELSTWFEATHATDILHNWPLLAKGLAATLTLACVVYGASLVLAMLVSLVRHYRLPVLGRLADAYVYGLRSIPLIMLIALMHYGVLPWLGLQYSFFFSAFAAFCLSTVAYMAEIFRGGFESLRPEELESAASIGLNPLQQLLYVMVPLIVIRILPALINQGVTLIKDTSLASIIGVIELTRSAEIIYERTLHEITLLVFIAMVYFLLCTTLNQLARKLERPL